MIRRFNFTGRIKILQNSVSLLVKGISTTSVEFNCETKLEDYGFPSQARVFVEVYSKSYIRKRFPMGTIEVPLKLASVSIPEFVNFPNFNFRIYVIDARDHLNVILGRSSPLFSATDDDGIGESSILPVRYVDDLNQVWRLDFNSDLPCLHINNKIPGIRELVGSNDSFRHTILPAAFKEILISLFLLSEDPHEEDDMDSPQGKWAKFIKDTLGKRDDLEILLNDEEDDSVTTIEKMESIERIVEHFTKRHFSDMSEYNWGS